MARETNRSILLEIKALLKRAFSVNGVIVTLLILVLAAFISSAIQDRIQKEKYLELLELEIFNNNNIAITEIMEFKNTGIIYNHSPFQISAFEGGLQNGYILTLDSNSLSHIYAFYTSYLPLLNTILEKDMNLKDDLIQKKTNV